MRSLKITTATQKTRMATLGAILLTLFFLVTASRGADIDYEILAANFLKHLNSARTIRSIQLIEASALAPDLPPIPVACRVDLSGGGYILIAPSTQLTPIKAYSLKADFDTLPAAYRQFLLREMEYNVPPLAPWKRAPGHPP